MFKRSFKLAGVALVAASLAFTGCGSRTEATTGGSAGTAKVAKIGVIAPLSGDLSALGLGIRNSVDLAIRQANETKAIPGWTLELAAEDDQATPDVGKNAATKLASDDAVVGVVGTLNSSVAQSVIPVLDSAKIVQVSPANTNPTLTKGADCCQPEASERQLLPHLHHGRRSGSVRRAVPAGQGHQEGRHHPRQEVLRSGPGDGVQRRPSPPVAARSSQPRRSTRMTRTSPRSSPRSRPTGPEAVYYGGEYPQAGPLSKQMKAAGLNVPLMGGDGIYDRDVHQAGRLRRRPRHLRRRSGRDPRLRRRPSLRPTQAAGSPRALRGLRRATPTMLPTPSSTR